MGINRRELLGSLAAAGTGSLLFGSGALAQSSKRMTVTAGHPPLLTWVKVLDEFLLPEIAKRCADLSSPTAIEWRTAYSGTVAKIGSESEALRTNISDFGIVAQVFEAARFPLQQVTVQVPFGTPDMKIISRAMRKLHDEIPAMAEAWQQNNIQYVAAMAIDNYALLSKRPIERFEDMAGLRILAPGAVGNWLRDTGAVATNGNLNTYYNDLQTGVADGVIVSLGPSFGVKLHEVAPYIARVDLGAHYTASVTANLRTLRSLPDEVQQIILDLGPEYEEVYASTQAQVAETSLENMIAGGAKYYEMPLEERQKWANALPHLGREWVQNLNNPAAATVLEAYLAELEKEGAESVRDWSL